MMASDQPPASPKKASDAPPTTADIIPLRRREIPAEQPADLTGADALQVIRALAVDTGKIVVIRYGRKKAGRRGITRRQIELCVQKGTPTEGPFLNQHGNWQMNLYRHAAGEEITCVVAIDWPSQVLVINAF